ncbi:Osmotin thaumatin-like protein [Hymenopellis radicata]|nr:Osmotin thaumatin-like protein [Hymenopellis radicata]
MKFSAAFAALASTLVVSSSAFTINFQNNCGYTVWAAIGKAPYGQPDTSVSYGVQLGSGASASYGIDDYALVRYFPPSVTHLFLTSSSLFIGHPRLGRTGCDGNGANCATGGCNGGLVCNDAGITSGVILSEYGYGDFGAYGGQRTAWDLSRVDASINIPTTLSSSDGQSVTCSTSSCPDDQAYSYSTDYAADRNSALGQTFTHKFC